MLCSTYHSTGLKFLVQSDCKAHKLYHTLGTQALPNTNTWNTYCTEFSAHLLKIKPKEQIHVVSKILTQGRHACCSKFSAHTPVHSCLHGRFSLFVTVLMKIDTFDPLAQRNKSKLRPNLAILLGIYALFGVLLQA